MDIYRVDDLRIDVGRRIVSRGDADIPVPKLSFDLLLVLVRAAPNVGVPRRVHGAGLAGAGGQSGNR